MFKMQRIFAKKSRKTLYNNLMIEKLISKKMPMNGNLVTLFLLVSSFFSIGTLSGYFNIETALAAPGNLQDDSNNQFPFTGSFDRISSFGSQGGTSGGSSLFEDPDYMISMTYPSDWIESPHPDDPEGLLIQLKPQGRQDAYFALFVFGLPESGTTQQDLNDQNLQLLREDHRIAQTGTINMARGDEAFFIDYVNQQDQLKATAVSLVKNDNEYYIEFGGTPEGYDRYLPDAVQMVSSIDIGDYSSQGSSQQGTGDDTGSQGFGQQGTGDDTGSQGFGQQGTGDDTGSQGFGQQSLDQDGGSNSLLEYSNPNLGFRISYPAQAEIVEEPNNVMFNTEAGAALVLVDTDVGVELNEYSDIRIGEIRDAAEGFHVISSEDVTFSGNPAHLLIYSTQEGNTMLRALVLWTISDDTAYNLIFIAPVSTIDGFIPVAETMMDSFEMMSAGDQSESEETENDGFTTGFRS
jgi:hypothetical protein